MFLGYDPPGVIRTFEYGYSSYLFTIFRLFFLFVWSLFLCSGLMTIYTFFDLFLSLPLGAWQSLCQYLRICSGCALGSCAMLYVWWFSLLLFTFIVRLCLCGPFFFPCGVVLYFYVSHVAFYISKMWSWSADRIGWRVNRSVEKLKRGALLGVCVLLVLALFLLHRIRDTHSLSTPTFILSTSGLISLFIWKHVPHSCFCALKYLFAFCFLALFPSLVLRAWSCRGAAVFLFEWQSDDEVGEEWCRDGRFSREAGEKPLLAYM